MRPGRLVVLVWTLVIAALVVLEIAEVTRLFTVPVLTAVGDPLVLLVSFLFTTIIAVIGAIFVGISMTARLLNPRGFTPFEEEMLKMRADLQELRRTVESLARRGAPATVEPPSDGPTPAEPDDDQAGGP